VAPRGRRSLKPAEKKKKKKTYQGVGVKPRAPHRHLWRRIGGDADANVSKCASGTHIAHIVAPASLCRHALTRIMAYA